MSWPSEKQLRKASRLLKTHIILILSKNREEIPSSDETQSSFESRKLSKNTVMVFMM